MSFSQEFTLKLMTSKSCAGPVFIRGLSTISGNARAYQSWVSSSASSSRLRVNRFFSRQGKAVTLYDLLVVNEINLTCQQRHTECHFYAWHTHNWDAVSPTPMCFFHASIPLISRLHTWLSGWLTIIFLYYKSL